MGNAKRRLIDLVYGSDLYATRFMLGVAELTWALSLFWPGATFGRPTYHGMQQIMPEEMWATAFLLTGLIQFQILASQRFHTKFAVTFAAWNSFLWTVSVLSMYMSVYPPPAAISGELALAFGASWVFIRSGVPAIPFERRHTHGGDRISSC